MKRVLLAALLICGLGVSELSAQQEPSYTHYMFNQLTYNPAYAGTRDGICASILYHNQWAKFSDPEGAISPLTQTFSLHSPLPSVEVKGKFGGYPGLGLYVVNDKAGFIGSTGFNLAGSWIMKKLWRAASISVGLNLGMMQQSASPTWKPRDPNDPRLPGSSSSTVFDAGFGVWLNSLNWFAGASAMHLPGSKAQWDPQFGTEKIEYPIVRAYYLTGGYTYHGFINSNFDLQGYGEWETDMVKSVVSVSAHLMWKQMLYGGLNVRFEKLTLPALMAGYYVPPKFTGGKGSLMIGVSYDIPTKYASQFGGTPEVFARYCFNLNLRTIEPVPFRSTRWL